MNNDLYRKASRLFPSEIKNTTPPLDSSFMSGLTLDQLNAIDQANTPSLSNPFSTKNDTDLKADKSTTITINGETHDLSTNQIFTVSINGGDADTLDGLDSLHFLDRTNHTGTQDWSTVTGTPTTLSGYGITDAQALDGDLTDIAGLSPSNDDIIQRKSGSWTNRTPAQFKTDLSLTKSDVGLSNVDNTSDATKNTASAVLTNKTISGNDNTLTDISISSLDITGTPDGTKFLRDDGSWQNVVGVTDGDKGDITVGSSGTSWTIDAGVVDDTNISDVAWSKVTSTPTTLSGYGITDAQSLDSDLTAIAGLSPSNDDIIQRKSGSWTNRTMAQLKTDLSLSASDVGLGNVENTALSTWTGSSSITTLGTISTGTWQGTAIGDTYISSASTWNAKLSTLTVDDTTITSGTAGRIFYENSSNEFSQSAGLSWDEANVRLIIDNGSNSITSGVDANLFVDVGSNSYGAEYKGSGSYTGFLVTNTEGTGIPFVQFHNVTNNKYWTIQLETDETFAIREGGAAGTQTLWLTTGGDLHLIGNIYGVADAYTSGGYDGLVLNQSTGKFEITAVLGNPMTTEGDIIYSSDGSGTPDRLAVGSEGDVLTVSSGVPTWAAPTGGSSVSFGSDNQIPYTNSTTDDFDYSANLTFDGDKLTVTSGAAAGESLNTLTIVTGEANATSMLRLQGTGLRSAYMGLGAADHVYIKNQHGTNAAAGIIFQNRIAVTLASFTNTIAHIPFALTVNEAGGDFDTRIEGDTNTHLVFVDAGLDRVGINTSSPSAKLHVVHTAEQMRVGYDASNYLSVTVGSTGSTTIGLTGTSPVLTLDMPVNFGAETITNYAADINAQTGTSYTLQASDMGKIVTCSNAGSITVEVPSGLPAGFTCTIVQLGTGQVTFSPDSTTVNHRQSHTKIAGQYGVATLVQYTTDTYVLGGDTAS